ERRGTHSITRTGLRVDSLASLQWWQDYLQQAQVAHPGIVERDGRPTLDFEDPEGQRLSLVVDGSPAPASPWERSPVPPEHQIRGLGPITLSVPQRAATEQVLIEVLRLRRERQYSAASAN